VQADVAPPAFDVPNECRVERGELRQSFSRPEIEHPRRWRLRTARSNTDGRSSSGTYDLAWRPTTITSGASRSPRSRGEGGGPLAAGHDGVPLRSQRRVPECQFERVRSVDLTALFSNPVNPNPLDEKPPQDADAEVAGLRTRRVKQVQRRLTPDEVVDLVRRYQAGETAELLAAAFQIHRTTVTAHLQRNGIQRRGGGRRVLAASDVQVAAELYEAGQSLASIGRQFDVHHTTVANELRQAGVEIRPRRGLGASGVPQGVTWLM